jgi:hypothetical protein
VADQAESSGRHWKDPPDTADSFLQQIAVLQEGKQEIGVILRVLHEADLPLNLLENNLVDVHVPDLRGAARARSGSEQADETVRLAVYLHTIARECRNIVEDRRFNEFLRTVRYTKENTEVLLAAFNELADAWSAYQPVINRLDVAEWGERPSPDQIWIALKRPRREYIDALGAYYVQLLNVINKLEADPNARRD